MREILFRGKRIDNGEWIEGFVVINEPYAYILVPTGTEENGTGIDSFPVDISTVGQCIPGLIDKNGKEIFEGDIVRLPNNSIDNYSIDIVHDVGRVVIHNHRDMELDTDFSIWDGCDLEVIGNVHDNYELLDNSELLEDKP